jgi:hypothetical protein
MRAVMAGVALAAALVAAGTAAAQDGACDAGEKKVKAVRLTTGDMFKDLVVQTMLPRAIEDPALDSDKVNAQPKTCARGAFQAGGIAYQAFGAKGDRAVRWAAPDNGDGPIAYLVPMDPAKPKGTLLMVVQKGAAARIVRAYNKLPNDEALRLEFTAAVLGQFPPVVDYDRVSKKSNIYVTVK